MKKIALMLALLATVSLSSFAYAGDGNTLFNPTPEKEMRAMTTERSSKADGPFSVDAGHFQIESNFYTYIYNDDCAGGSCTKTRQHIGGGVTNLRLGLTDNTDIQIVSDLYRYLQTKDGASGAKDTTEGFGDTQIRLKINLVGNDPSSKFSLGILPFVKLPTNQNDLGNDDVEGGLELPFNVNFDGGWSLGGMTAVNGIKQLDDSGFDPAYINAITVGKSLTDKLSAYGEFYTSRADQSDARWANTLDFGVAYMVTPNFRLDANTYLGVSEAADDINMFFGGAYRF